VGSRPRIGRRWTVDSGRVSFDLQRHRITGQATSVGAARVPWSGDSTVGRRVLRDRAPATEDGVRSRLRRAATRRWAPAVGCRWARA